MKVIIVGGVAGGASAAARLRRMDEKAEIILFEKGEYISYANCGLPYYVGEVIKDKDKLVVTTPEMMKERFNIDVRTNSEVINVLPNTKEIEVYNRINNQTYLEKFDKLILSPGAEPIKPPFPGVNNDNIFTLRNIPDTYAIKDYVDQKNPKRAVVVGGGFIGLEVAENLYEKGLQVTVVELANQVMAPLDPEMAAIVHQHMKLKQVELFLENGVKSFTHHKDHTIVELQSGKKLETDIVILGIGVRPDTKLAVAAGLELGPTKGIKVDNKLKTSNPDIYAVGDAIEIIDYVSGKPALIPLAGPANKQGRIVANDICGIEDEYKGTQGSSIAKIFDLTVATTGNNEKLLKRYDIPYLKSYTHSASHAGYYPGSIPMAIKLLFSPEDGKILGAEIVGYDGVDKRIDVLATSLRAGLSVYDLQELELAYAPPYSSAKDPVNMAGFVASNILNNDVKVFHWDEIDSLDLNESILVDVRTEEEHNLGYIPNSINIPIDNLREQINKLPKDKSIEIYCQVGLRGYLASRILTQEGFKNVRNLSGGYKTYSVAIEKQSNEDAFLNSPEINNVNLNDSTPKKVVNMTLDACGLQCPGPIMQLYKSVENMNTGEIIEVKATDPGFELDVKTWCNRTGNEFLSSEKKDKHFVVYIKKGSPIDESNKKYSNDKSMVVFSGDLDKALAAFIIANGAASMSRKVTMFFTFWGLNIIRKPKKMRVKKNFISKMFGRMMPRGVDKLKLSNMHMGGMGTKMMKFVMKNKNIDTLETLIQQAKFLGVRLVACNMSMDVMGLAKEELLEGVETGGVASFLGAAEESDTTLFI